MDDGIPTLSVGFAIETGGSFESLAQLDRAMGTTEAKVLADANRIEKATSGMVNLGGATAQVTMFGNAYSRETQSIAVQSARAEKAGEGMVRSLTRQAETFGKTAAEIRAMRAELRAAEAESLGMTELAGRIRAASAELDRLEGASLRSATGVGKVGAAAKLSRGDMVNLGYQVNDVVVSLASGQKPLTVFIQQGAQIGQIAAASGVGLRGMAAGVAALAAPFLPLIALVGAATAGFAMLVRYVNEGVTNDQLTRDLGKITGGADATKQELYKLKDETITWGDTTSALFSVVGKDIAEGFVGDIAGMVDSVKSLLDDLTSYGKMALAGIYAGAKGTQLYMAEVSTPGGLLKAVAGDPTLLARTYGKAYHEADAYLTKLGKRVKAQALTNARERLADKIGYNAPEKPKTDRTAERLARENAAIEAQIRGLYALADAWGISSAAALIAEAAAKAESAAIKKKGDIEQFIAREIRLSVAQRVADAAKSAAAMRDEADQLAGVNTLVAEGLIPAERAGEILRRRMAELPLLAAIEAAQQKGLKTEAERATAALEAQRDAQAAMDAAKIGEWAASTDAAAERRLADLRAELDLVGQTDAVRIHTLATIRATNEATAAGAVKDKPYFDNYVSKQVEIADLEHQRQLRLEAFNDGLRYQADLLDILAGNVARAGQGMEEAFGRAGGALGDLATRFSGYMADQKRLDDARRDGLAKAADFEQADQRAAAERRVNALYDAKTMTARIGLYGDMTHAAKGFFAEGSRGWKALETAEKVFRAVEFALSVRAIAQDAIETGSAIAKSGARAAAHAVEAVAKAIASLPFPANLAAGAATAAALAAIGLSIAGSFGGGRNTLTKANEGQGTVLGDAEAKSESIRRAIDGLKEVDTLMLSASREMSASLRSIDQNIGGFATALVRSGNIDADSQVTQGFKPNAIGSVLGAIPLVGGLLKSLFGTKTSVIGSGIYGGGQTIADIMSGGFAGQTYSDVQSKKKFLGITTSTKYSTVYGGSIGDNVTEQVALIFKSFNDAIVAAAGPLGASTDEIAARVSGFVFTLGKVDLTGLSGEEIEAKLSNIFSAAADGMAAAAIPGIERWQQVGEGAFETLIRVASTVETVTSALNQMGFAARNLSIDAKLGIADQFDSARDFATAADAYVRAYYTKAEQNAAMLERFGQVFVSLGVTMPRSLADFRALVEAQDLTSASGQATYATLLKLAPAFADLMSSMEGAKSAADVLAERQDLERKLLELNGDTAAIRALDLAKLDASNRALQQQIWAIQDAQEAARAAEDLRKAWTSVGDSLLDEVKRIRGLDVAAGEGGFATLMGRFNAASLSARGGDQDAAKSLPGLSQELLRAAENAARSQQELDRVRAQTAASLEETYAAISRLGAAKPAEASTAALLAAMQNAPAVLKPGLAHEAATDEVRTLRAEVADLKATIAAGLAAVAGNTGRMAKKLDDVTAASGGDAVATVRAA